MQRSPRLAALLLLASACDAAIVAQAETKTQADAAAAANADVAADAALAADAAVAANVDVAAQANAGANVEISADAFKLAEVTALIQAGTIETAEELELAVNDPEANLNRIDLDADGQIDHIEVVEVRGDAKVDFQFKVIPSTRATVVHAVDLATATVVADRASSQVSFSAGFSAGVHFSAGAAVQADLLAFVAPARFEASAVFVAQPLLAWAFVVDRPVYASVYIEQGTGKWVPPGHLKHGHWKATGELQPGLVASHGGKVKAGGKARARGDGGLGGGFSVGFDASAHASAGGKAKAGASVGGGHKPSPKPKQSSSAPKPQSKPQAKPSGGGGKGGGGKGKK